MHPSPLSLIINGVRKMVVETLIFGLQDDGQDVDFDDHDGVVDDNVLIMVLMAMVTVMMTVMMIVTVIR